MLFLYPFEHTALESHLKRREEGPSSGLGISVLVGTTGARLLISILQKIPVSQYKGAKDLQMKHQKVNMPLIFKNKIISPIPSLHHAFHIMVFLSELPSLDKTCHLMRISNIQKTDLFLPYSQPCITMLNAET